MKLSKLYKLTSLGAIEEWEIWTEKNVIHVQHGQQDGKKQHVTDTIKEGKNIGRSNETTPIEQAELEAKAKWTRKLDKDYRKTEAELKKMKKEKTASAGGYLPMLAHKYKDQKKKMPFPCYVQPKLDGLRCIATCNGGVKLWFRSGKPITTMSHIVKELKKIMKPGEIFDGELFTTKTDFNKICGAIRRDKHMKEEKALLVEYHIYDAPRVEEYREGASFDNRMFRLRNRFFKSPLNLVTTIKVKDEEEAMEMYAEYMEQGYEGIMFRHLGGEYEQKRSYTLLKYKEFQSAEWTIIGVEEGRGLLSGCVGAFILDAGNGKTFKAKLKGKDVTNLLRTYFKNPKSYMGKKLEVIYQDITDGIPRFPVGKCVREDLG